MGTRCPRLSLQRACPFASREVSRNSPGSASPWMPPGHNAFWSFDPRNATTPPVTLPAVSASETTSAPSRLSVSDYFAEYRRQEGEVQVDYDESPDEAPGSSNQPTSGATDLPAGDASHRVLCTPNQFPERPAGLLAVREFSEPRDPSQREVDSALEEAVVTNDLKEAQSRHVELELQALVSRRPVARPPLTPSVGKYGFQRRGQAETARQAASQLLNSYVIAPAVRTPEELAQRTALHKCFLTQQVTTLSECRERLRVQGQRGSVPHMRTYPVVLEPGEDYTENDARFELWVEKSRRLSSMDALRASFSEVDARLERRLRFDYAKLRAKRRLPAGFQSRPRVGDIHYAPLIPSASPVQEEEGVAVARGQPLSIGADPAAPQPIAPAYRCEARALGALLIPLIKSVHDTSVIMREGHLKFP
ncbi:unnamed protein product [Phytophthora fragariaefolia]|uniref:Unnamed protein product n=1 Tax=Phytophthora fragariaefolia TaxID=1490495 RepID=A0A9W6Y660_9STRA|nr:unnamed protein product [Phytophthora fragariaefolia]